MIHMEAMYTSFTGKSRSDRVLAGSSCMPCMQSLQFMRIPRHLSELVDLIRDSVDQGKRDMYSTHQAVPLHMVISNEPFTAVSGKTSEG